MQQENAENKKSNPMNKPQMNRNNPDPDLDTKEKTNYKRDETRSDTMFKNSK